MGAGQIVNRYRNLENRNRTQNKKKHLLTRCREASDQSFCPLLQSQCQQKSDVHLVKVICSFSSVNKPSLHM